MSGSDCHPIQHRYVPPSRVWQTPGGKILGTHPLKEGGNLRLIENGFQTMTVGALSGQPLIYANFAAN